MEGGSRREAPVSQPTNLSRVARLVTQILLYLEKITKKSAFNLTHSKAMSKR